MSKTSQHADERPGSAEELGARRFEAIVASIQDPLVCIDRRGLVTLFNASAERVFGYAAQDVVGKHVGMLMPTPYRENHDGFVADYETTGTRKAIGYVREVFGLRASGETFPIELSVSEARTSDGVTYAAVLRDVSALTAARAAAQNAERRLVEVSRAADERAKLSEIGAVVARIVHDLGNPIAGLKLQAQLLARAAARAESDETIVEPTERILATIDRLHAMILDLKDFARTQRIDRKSVDIGRLMRDVAELWTPVAAQRAIRIEIEPSDVRSPIPLDPDKLRRVIDNLVKNAIEAVDSDGSVTLRVRRSKDGIRITVADTGPGIPDGVDVFRLFETTKAAGSGLGLSIARELVAAHHGTLAFERLAPTGTAFHVDLPIDPSPASASSA